MKALSLPGRVCLTHPTGRGRLPRQRPTPTPSYTHRPTLRRRVTRFLRVERIPACRTGPYPSHGLVRPSSELSLHLVVHGVRQGCETEVMAGPDGARGTPQPLQSLGVVKYGHFTSGRPDDKEIGGDSGVTTIRKWTGREASALREAERLSLREFAGRLGVSERVVSKWEARGADIVPRPLSQGILDTRLANTSDDVRARFELFLGMAAPKTAIQWS